MDELSVMWMGHQGCGSMRDMGSEWATNSVGPWINHAGYRAWNGHQEHGVWMGHQGHLSMWDMGSQWATKDVTPWIGCTAMKGHQECGPVDKS